MHKPGWEAALPGMPPDHGIGPNSTYFRKASCNRISFNNIAIAAVAHFYLYCGWTGKTRRCSQLACVGQCKTQREGEMSSVHTHGRSYDKSGTR